MAILDEDVARVRAETDFVAVAGEHIALKRQGRRFVGLCPFHAEKTPSFSINAEEGLYYCFGCQASGDVITFVREVEHLDFVGAVEFLAARAAIQLRYDQATGTERRRTRPLQDALEAAVDFYHERLVSGPDSAAARRYLRQERGYDGDIVRKFKIGWAPDEWDALSRSLSVPDAVLRDTGLGFVNSRGRRQDAFRARIMFPIFDPGGRPVAFGGRLLPGGGVDGPKYKNSADTPLYSKHRTLYGLNWAKSGIVEAGEVVVCEGYTDV
ncbi:MAG TPA: CHC2 zinc finger domain-containing protein, partial [Acidimicrobiales bacterium]|nr:CHC2 zinc finger domain-containing protein [Acidimicrobiales bacterium]